MNDNLEQELGGAIWEEDDRDYLIEDILGADEVYNFPQSFEIPIEEENQGALKETHYACTCYSAYHAVQATLAIVNALDKKLNPLEGFRKQKTYGTFKEGVGDYVRTALKSIIDNGVIKEDGTKVEIEGYALIGRGKDISHDKLKHFIAKGYGLITTYNLRKTDDYKKSGYLTPSKGAVVGGHAVAITGYTKDYVIIANSYGNNWGKFKNGTFRVKFEDLFQLMGIYILYPKQQINMIYPDFAENAPFAEEVKLMKELGIVTGTAEGRLEPHRPLTRLEGVIMMSRLYKKLKG